MKNWLGVIFCAVLALLFMGCDLFNSGGGQAKYSQEFLGEWIRMDTGERWYITGDKITVDGAAGPDNVTLTRTAAEVVKGEYDGSTFSLFASRIAGTSFSAQVVVIGGGNSSARDVVGGDGQRPPVKVTNLNQPGLAPVVVRPDPDTGRITVPNYIPGDEVEIVPDSSEWKNVKVNFTPWADQNMGLIPLAHGVNLKAAVTLGNIDMSELYADGSTLTYTITIENIGTENCVGASYEIFWDEDDFTYVSGAIEGRLDTIAPGAKKQISLRLGSKPITEEYKNKEIKVTIISYNVNIGAVARWEDTVSVNFYKEWIPFSFSSQKPVQGVIRTPRNKTYYFKTAGTSGTLTTSVNVPWSTDEYIVTFLGASVEEENETFFSMAVDRTPPTNWSSLLGEARFQYEGTNGSADTAPLIDLSSSTRSFIYYLYTEAVQYYRVKLTDTAPGKSGGNVFVTFDTNGGSSVSTQTVVYGTTAGRPTNPTRSGYLLEGWYSDPELTLSFNFSTNITADITLYAKWDEIASVVEMVLVPAGSFVMGSPSTEAGRNSNEGPQHDVTLSGFVMGKYAVTQKLYEAVTGTNPVTAVFGKGPRLPVNEVSWYDAVEFCNKLSAAAGYDPVYTISGTTVTADWTKSGFRLPTEAEWEYACRAGTTTAYNTGELISDDTGWYSDNSPSVYPSEVGQKPPNAWGLYDMHGNIREWCWDWYGTYASEEQTDPRGPAPGTYRITRGGHYNSQAVDLRSASRASSRPSSTSGLRVVRNLDTSLTSFTVTFNSNGGTEVAAQTAYSGLTAVRPVDPTFEDHFFGGWYSDPALTTPYNFSDIMVNSITLYAKWYNYEPFFMQLARLQANAESGGNYTLEVHEDEATDPVSFYFSGKNNITITLRGIGGEQTLSLASNGSMFTVYSGVTFILEENITLRGRGDNTAVLIKVNSGGMIMNDGTKITGNAVSDTGTGGGGVCVDNGSSFTMNGGEISGNSSTGGGGVYVSGSFAMTGGKISGNSSGSNGGGVYVNNGSFTMTGGEISGNSSSGYGGGVYGSFTMTDGKISGNSSSGGGGVYAGSFTMSGGEISGNIVQNVTGTVSSAGGGVYVGTSFTKTGGIITGYASDTENGNVVKVASGAAALNSLGHAVFATNGGSPTNYVEIRRESTARADDNLTWDRTTKIWTGGWEYVREL